MNKAVKQLFVAVGLYTLVSVSYADFLVNEIAGFDDSTPATPVGGNSGTTVGEQRSIVFATVASDWTGIASPSVDITIDATFEPLTPCSANSGVVGSAGASGGWINFPSLIPDTIYPTGLVQHLEVSNSNPAGSAVNASFNSNIGNPGCLENSSWYMGLDRNPGFNQIDMYSVVLHEIAHGLGFSSWVNLSTGAKASGFDDVYSNFLRDESLGLGWPAMSNAQRQASAIDTDDLVWTGADTLSHVAMLDGGLNNNQPEMYAPNPLQSGSSVSHWDVDVDYISGNPMHEVMEYREETPVDMALTVALFRDLGWNGIYDFDGDGTNDADDDFSHTDAASTDTDDDGMPDDWENCSGASCGGYTLDGDDDNDGVQDVVDADPLDGGNTNETSLPLDSNYDGVQSSN